MNFKDFLSKIERYKALELGGLEAQFKMAPKLRLTYNKNKIKANNPRKAAVLALFYPDKNNTTTLLLTKRASYKGTHSAQISFPGGKIEQNDINLQETALRETFEEVGVASSTIKVIRQLTDVYIPPSNFLATPFIGFTHQRPTLTKNHEVAELIEVSLKDVLNDEHLTTVNLTTSYMKNIDVPCFKIDNHIIWGATGMMLSEIKELLK
ncbi:NUDIX hydrolase [Polaribacter sp. R77954]|uniref:NUDIX hydrolase n=1 Tax=Polaribacter sp. R77954 TaxID=3093870 RepID=UPI0037CA72A6